MAKAGRKPLDANDPSVNVCFRLPSREFVALDARAQRQQVSIAELIRRELAKEMLAPRPRRRGVDFRIASAPDTRSRS